MNLVITIIEAKDLQGSATRIRTIRNRTPRSAGTGDVSSRALVRSNDCALCGLTAAKDENGLSDPFVELRFGSEVRTSPLPP